MSRLPKRVIIWGATVFMALLLFGNQGFRKLFRLYEERRRLTAALEQLRADNERLTRELSRIQQDPSYTEYLIRKNLQYVKKGEVEYRVLKGKK